MPEKNTAKEMTTMLHNDSVPLAHRRRLLMQLCVDESDESIELLDAVLKASKPKTSAKSVYTKKIKELDEFVQELQAGPLREATFLNMHTGKGLGQRACVVLEDGTRAFVMVPEAELIPELRFGDTVLIEAGGKAVLFRDDNPTTAGETALLERRLDGRRLEVTLRDHEKHVFLATDDLNRLLDDEEVEPGASLLVCPRRMLAFSALPSADGLSHYRFLDRRPVPDVLLERDVGDPPAYIDEVTQYVRKEMTDPERRHTFRLPRCVLRFLSGVSGSGKTYSLMALQRRLYEIMSEVTGDPIDMLPPRVVRLRPGQFLSQWLGVADQNLERFFDEIEQLAAETYTASDGRVWELPVLAILEEADGLARRRGGEAIYDRIMTTILQRLDPSRPELREAFLVIVATTNTASQCDPAFLRRVSGQVERFGRLGRNAFRAVLAKHLRDLPVDGNPNVDAAQRERDIQAELVGWMFRPVDRDLPLVEISLAGNTQPLRKYRCDLLTAALIERAVQQAAREAYLAEDVNGEASQITSTGLIVALEDQLQSVCSLLDTHNAADYVDLPDSAHVVNVVRIEQPALLPQQVMGAA